MNLNAEQKLLHFVDLVHKRKFRAPKLSFFLYLLLNAMAKVFTVDEVATHNTEDSFWMIIDGHVYDLTNFLAMHPGGEVVLKPFAGKDAT
jgi:cytochrome b involved in lipid metabolism